jgi:hypothetical protein
MVQTTPPVPQQFATSSAPVPLRWSVLSEAFSQVTPLARDDNVNCRRRGPDVVAHIDLGRIFCHTCRTQVRSVFGGDWVCVFLFAPRVPRHGLTAERVLVDRSPRVRFCPPAECRRRRRRRRR